MRTHFTWSVENPDGTCPFCGSRTVLIRPYDWEMVPTEDGDEGYSYEEIDDELTAHACDECHRVVSLSLNTLDQKPQ